MQISRFMKRLLLAGLLAGLGLQLFAQMPRSDRDDSGGWGNGSTLNVFVSPSGNDNWSGLLPAPNRRGTDGPFRTLHHARAFVSGVNRAHLTRINVFFRGGFYPLQSTTFSSADSGSETMEIVYQNYPGEEAVLSGGVRLTGWVRTDRNRWVASLPAGTVVPFENLYYNGERRLRPRLGDYLGTTAPTDGTSTPHWNRVVDPVYSCTKSDACNGPGSKDGMCTDDSGELSGQGNGYECFDRFHYDPSDPDPIRSTWTNLAPQKGNPCNAAAGDHKQDGDIELLIFEQFSTSKLRLSCVDDQHSIVYLYGKTTPPNINKDNPPPQPQQQDFSPDSRYVVENVEDELTLPGQWFLDLAAKQVQR